MSVKFVLNFAKAVMFLALEAPFRPRWAYYRLCGFYYKHYKNRFHAKHISEYHQRLRPMYSALEFITNHGTEEISTAGDSEIINNMKVHEGTDSWVVALPGEDETTVNANKGPIGIYYGPSPEQLKSVHIICRLLRPEIVVETGVAKGFTSAVILDALKNNGTGNLYSVEMPSLYFGYTQQVGEKIPKSLRNRWHLELGPSALMLPRLLKRLGTIDVFVYDSASSYDNQVTEFNIVLPYLRPGGVLITNFLMTDAFFEVAEAHNCRWTTIEQTKVSSIGLLTKLEI